jgi:transcriptional regulator with XRE-family HTH domain
VIARAGLSQAAFAGKAGVDRSTLAQLMTDEAPRLPRADTLTAIATTYRVSVDWLLGLSQREEIGAEIIEAVLKFEPHAGAPVDDRFAVWLREAEGYRVRTVPATFPDFLKTEKVLRREYRTIAASDQSAALDAMRARAAFIGEEKSDIEACVSLQALTGFARGEGQWNGLSIDTRRAQLNHIVALTRELYPALRLHLYDLRDTYSVPFTVFGPKRVAVFLGPSFLVLNAAEHIRLFARRFDDLIRLAVVQPHEVAGFLERQRGTLRSRRTSHDRRLA